MNEKLFHTVKSAGIWDLVMGVVILITGLTSGILLLVNAFRLLKGKQDMMI